MGISFQQGVQDGLPSRTRCCLTDKAAPKCDLLLGDPDDYCTQVRIGWRQQRSSPCGNHYSMVWKLLGKEKPRNRTLQVHHNAGSVGLCPSAADVSHGILCVWCAASMLASGRGCGYNECILCARARQSPIWASSDGYPKLGDSVGWVWLQRLNRVGCQCRGKLCDDYG
jgi:hypothetical protein